MKFDREIVLGFAGLAVLFLSIAAAVILRVSPAETMPVTHRVPTATWRVEIRNCCGQNMCLIERHHRDIKFEWRNVEDGSGRS